MKLLPLIGSLLISAAPVQAFETYKEVEKACDASEEIGNLCVVASQLGAGMMTMTMLCYLEEKGRITKENLVLTLDEVVSLNGWAPLPDEAVEMTLEKFPECSIKPIP